MNTVGNPTRLVSPCNERKISEMRRVVRPGGVVAACVWDTYGGFPLFRMFWDTVAAIDPAAEKARSGGYFRPLAQAGELTAAFEAAGLEYVLIGATAIIFGALLATRR